MRKRNVRRRIAGKLGTGNNGLEAHTTIYEPPANMSCEAAALVARAIEFAARRGETQVLLKYLWAAIAAEPNPARSLWFGTHWQPDERAETRISRNLMRQWGLPGLKPVNSRNGGARSRPRLADTTQRVLNWAADEARELRHSRIGTEHILLALMRTVRERLFRTAEQYCESYAGMRHEVAHLNRRIEIPSPRVRTQDAGLRTARRACEATPRTGYGRASPAVAAGGDCPTLSSRARSRKATPSRRTGS